MGLATKVKTLRLPEDVIETIETFPGESFTDKFVAAARLLGRDREKLEKQLRDLEHERQQKIARLADMGKFAQRCSYIEQGLHDVCWKMTDVVNRSKNLLDAYDEIIGADTSNKDV